MTDFEWCDKSRGTTRLREVGVGGRDGRILGYSNRFGVPRWTTGFQVRQSKYLRPVRVKDDDTKRPRQGLLPTRAPYMSAEHRLGQGKEFARWSAVQAFRGGRRISWRSVHFSRQPLASKGRPGKLFSAEISELDPFVFNRGNMINSTKSILSLSPASVRTKIEVVEESRPALKTASSSRLQLASHVQVITPFQEDTRCPWRGSGVPAPLGVSTSTLLVHDGVPAGIFAYAFLGAQCGSADLGVKRGSGYRYQAPTFYLGARGPESARWPFDVFVGARIAHEGDCAVPLAVSAFGTIAAQRWPKARWSTEEAPSGVTPNKKIGLMDAVAVKFPRGRTFVWHRAAGRCLAMGASARSNLDRSGLSCRSGCPYLSCVVN
ncbi:hypothetical protein OBBRIDRAFT_803124 [Obba rivulosa]|uniref:Uncharacterized protein n=1 Tax=Obba rivulosa TaxID=1052685 RepID=A0A8E2B0Y2_9APHY|nr:hypothetical protein OBBRIDRAFT_803124 [Obba rivulosa]